MKNDFYKDEVARLRAALTEAEAEKNRYRNAIEDFCDAWDQGLGGDSKFLERLRAALANGAGQPRPAERS